MMHRLNAFAWILVLGACVACGQSATSLQAQSGGGEQSASAAKATDVIGHGNIPVELTRALDSSKLAQGEAVEGKTSGEFVLPDGTKVPRGSRMTGHVAEAKARSKGDAQSDLTVVFDAIILSDQKEQPLKGLIQAVGPKPDSGEGIEDPMVSHQAGSGIGAPPSTTSGSNNRPMGTNSQEVLNPQSTGVKGIHNLELGSDGVLTSKGKTVKLDNGDRMIIHVELLKP